MMSKNTLIFGDSYSTFDKYIPDGYASYYTETPCPETDVTNVSETWWYQVAAEADLKIILNNSWSGSTICYTGYNNSDCSHSSSFIYRLNQLKTGGFFAENNINTAFVFGGTNDDWANAPLGTIKFDKIENEDLYSVLPAITYFFQALRSTIPEADIYCLVNTGLKAEIVEAFHKTCEKYDITEITFDKIDKRTDHPTIEGMCNIKNQVLKVLNNHKML